MSRRPVDQLNKNKKPHGQDGVWAEIRRLKTFTVTAIVSATDIDRKTVTDYVKRIEAGGYVKKSDDFEKDQTYTLVRDAGIHAPRVKQDGSPVTQGGGTQNMWQAMRMMRQFTPRDLAHHSTTDTVTVTEKTAHSYCSMLLKADYLRVIQKAKPGVRQATYKFIRNTGPIPPRIQRVKQVYDANLGEVTYSPGGRQ